MLCVSLFAKAVLPLPLVLRALRALVHLPCRETMGSTGAWRFGGLITSILNAVPFDITGSLLFAWTRAELRAESSPHEDGVCAADFP